MPCDRIADLAPEIALGIADGEERAEALRHLSTCADCRRTVDGLSYVADELLMLAPLQEPPAGFESRVVAALGLGPAPRPARRRRPSLRRVTRILAPALAAAAVTAVALVGVYHNDHVTAERYRDTLAEAGGWYFQAEPLKDASGTRGGVAFGYQGSPSWLLVTVDGPRREAVRTGQLVTRPGRTISMGSLRLDANGSWGGAIPVKLYELRSISLLGKGGTPVLQASFPRGVSERP